MAEVYEFFAGGGMVRLGLGAGWTCRFANDIDPRKAAAYRANFGGDELRLGDIRNVTTADLPGRADLAWASFPCQDLSLAGAGAGLAGARSGVVYPFWTVMGALTQEARAPRIIALENVCGALTANGGHDFASLGAAYAGLGYRFGALVIDAALFVPQSRPRLFLVGVRDDWSIPSSLLAGGPAEPFHTGALRRAMEALPERLREHWLWWRLPAPRGHPLRFAQAVAAGAQNLAWHTPQQTQRLLALMAPLHRAKVDAARRAGGVQVGAVYRRTRTGPDGVRAQRAEVRFDDVAGCLRTPGGGSSRQTLLVVDGDSIRSRLISARETARLMGLPEDYRLPERYTDAYHLTGDGVAVDVVRYLARHLFEPLLARAEPGRSAA